MLNLLIFNLNFKSGFQVFIQLRPLSQYLNLASSCYLFIMYKQKSKSNINIVQKKDIKPTKFILKSKDKHQDHHEQKFKLNQGAKKPKGNTKQSHSNKNTNFKSKKKLQKSSHPKILQQADHQLIFSVSRRNSASIVSQKAPSRLSNKRSSVISLKSNNFLKDEEHKENDQNRKNIDEIPIHENECIVQGLKKSLKKTKSKKKLSLDINLKLQGQVLNANDTNKKNQKGCKIEMFENKMSKYLNERNIFSEQFLQQTKINKTKSKKHLNAKSKQKIQENLAKSKKLTEKQNLIEIYQFYKKTFDINLNNCMKYSSHASKNDKSRQTASKNTIKPSLSSNLVFNKESNLNFVDSRIHLCERKNVSKSGSKSKQTLSKSKRNDSKSIYDKENRLFSHIKMSSMLESRSKSRNSIANNSQTSTKDNLLSYQVEKQYVPSTIEETNLRRSKKSYKNLIVFNQNQLKSNMPELNIKYFDKRKIQDDDDVQEMRKLNDLQGSEKAINEKKLFINQERSEVIDMRKVEVGQSNIDVLKWWSNSKRILSTSVIEHEKQNDGKNQMVEPKSPLLKNEPENQRDFRFNSQINKEKYGINQENFLLKKGYSQRDSPKTLMIEQETEKLKKKSDQISSLGDLSSISSIHQCMGSNFEIVDQNPNMIQLEDAAFQF